MKDIPAFPCHPDIENKLYDGMTLRDYFAAKALQGLLASDVSAPMQHFAVRSYKIADEMIKARAKEND